MELSVGAEMEAYGDQAAAAITNFTASLYRAEPSRRQGGAKQEMGRSQVGAKQEIGRSQVGAREEPSRK